MSRLKSVISDGTLIPISLLITVCLAVAWISDVAAQTRENARKIEAVEQDMEKISEMRERIARIEAKIDFLVKVEGISK